MRWLRAKAGKSLDVSATQEQGETKPTPAKRNTREARIEVTRRPLPDVEKMLEAVQLPPHLIEYARGTNYMIDHGFLSFGRIYRVKQAFKANRRGAFNKNDRIRFLGGSVFPYDNGLRLYFEHVETPGEACVLEFEGDFPEADGVLRMLAEGREGDYLSPYSGTFGGDQRGLDLLEAERILRKAALETERLVEEAYQDEMPR